MDLEFFLRGLVIGFSIAAPVGPIGVLTIQRTLSHGRLHGFLSGLGAATADAMYGMVAAFGLTFISGFLVSQEYWFKLVGGVFLVYLGVRAFLKTPDDSIDKPQQVGILGSYTSTFLLTLTNPMTILSFGAIFAGLGLAEKSSSYEGAALLVVGVFLGSAAWWLLLSSLTSIFRTRIQSPRGLLWVNRVSGLIIGGFGFAILFSLT